MKQNTKSRKTKNTRSTTTRRKSTNSTSASKNKRSTSTRKTGSNNNTSAKSSPKSLDIKKTDATNSNLTLKGEFIFALIIIIAFFFLISMYTEATGIVGTSLKEMVLGLFSNVGFLIPYLLFAFGVINMLDNLKSKRKNLNLALSLLFLVSILIQGILTLDYIKEKSFTPVFIINSYADGIALKGGGVLGNSIALLLYKPIGMWGIWIVLSLTIISFFIFAFKMKPTEIVENVGIKAVETTKNINESIKKAVNTKSKDHDFSEILDEYRRNKALRDKLDELRETNIVNLELDDDFLYTIAENKDTPSTKSKPTIQLYDQNNQDVQNKEYSNLAKYEDLKYTNSELNNLKIDELENEEKHLKAIAQKNLKIYAKIEEIAKIKAEKRKGKSYVEFKSKYPMFKDDDNSVNTKSENNESLELYPDSSIVEKTDLDLDLNLELDKIDESEEIEFKKIIINKFNSNKNGAVYEKIIDDVNSGGSDYSTTKNYNDAEYDAEFYSNTEDYTGAENYTDIKESNVINLNKNNVGASTSKDKYASLFNTKQRQENALKNPYIEEKFKDKPENLKKYNIDKIKNNANDKVKTSTEQVETDTEKDAEMLQLAYENYKLPSFKLFKDSPKTNSNNHQTEIMQNVKKLEETFSSFKIDARVINVSKGPMITRFEIQPNAGVKVSRIVSLSDDIALNLAATSVRIVAPIPGKAAIGIEIPNKSTSIVSIKDVLVTDAYKKKKSNLKFALGMDISGKPIVPDLANMPHLLIAGATGSGKSVCVNTIITSILCNAKPDEVKLLMIDPKVVELNMYSGIPHLILPVVTDPKKASIALNWAVQEMTERYNKFAEAGVKDIFGYNRKYELDADVEFMPRIVIIIDELSDLMMAAPNQVEEAICRIAQMARACGMHLIVATQRPSVDVITGLIKANIPSRIAFSVSSHVDSKTIIDSSGAEKLLGKGDMLYYPVGISKPMRVQGSFISEKEVDDLVSFVSKQTDGLNTYDETAIDDMNSSSSLTNTDNPVDELLDDAIAFVIDVQKASASLMQRKFRIGYNRAARIVEEMEERGIIGEARGSKPREVLVKSLDEL